MLEKQVKTSFIPNKPIQTVKAGGGLKRSKKNNFLSVVTFIIFIVILIVAGGTFVYKMNLNRVIDRQKESLVTIQESFNPVLINEASRLNKRIESVGYLLENHTSPSQIFNLLEKFTLKTVQFNSLTYTTEQDGLVRVSISGIADSFKTVVLQSDSYGDTGYLRDILFTDLQPNDQNNITFNLDGTIDAELVLYRNSLVPVNQEDAPSEVPPSQGTSFEFPENN